MKLDDLKIKAKAPEGVINIGFSPRFFDSIWDRIIDVVLTSSGATHFVNGTEDSDAVVKYLNVKLSKFLKNKECIFEVRAVDEIDDLKECLDIIAPDNYESWLNVKKIKDSDSLYVMDYDAILGVLGFLFREYFNAGVFDYLMANLDDVVKNPNVTPLTLIDLSKKWHKLLASKRKKKSKRNGGLRVVTIDTYEKAREESILLGHCLGASFGDHIGAGKYIAYSIRSTEDDGSINAHATIGFSITRTGLRVLDQMECRGHRTKVFKREYRNIIFKLFKELFDQDKLAIDSRSMRECRHHHFVMLTKVEGKKKTMSIIDPLFLKNVDEVDEPIDFRSPGMIQAIREYGHGWGDKITFKNTVAMTRYFLDSVTKETEVTINGRLVITEGTKEEVLANPNLKFGPRGHIKIKNG